MDAVIVAAGEGLRFNSKKPKILCQLANRPIISYSIRLLNSLEYIRRIVVVTTRENLPEIDNICMRFSKCLKPVIGGETRYASVRAGLLALKPWRDRVAIHDAARPLLTKGLMDRLEEKSRNALVTIPGIFVTDTMKEIDTNGFVKTTHDRKRLRSIQTPQIFHPDVLARFPTDGNPTDEATVAEGLGFPVLVVEGEITNLKITYKEDIDIADSIIKRGGNEDWHWL